MDTETKVDVAPEAQPRPTRRLEYDDTRPTGISRRQMSFFLLLLFINTLLFAAFICLPAASPMLKQMWTDWQSARAEARREAREKGKLQAVVTPCLTDTLAPDTLVYAEPPGDAAKILAASGRARVLSSWSKQGRPGLFGGGGGDGLRQPSAHEELLPDSGWREPAALAGTEPLNALRALLQSNGGPHVYPNDTVVFLHAVNTPGGKPRLVWISIEVQQSLVDPQVDGGTGDAGPKPPHVLETTRRLSADVFDPDDLDKTTRSTIVFIEPPGARSRVEFFDGDDASLRVKPWQPRGLWRIFAGQPDPADPTHFTIPYDIDGKPGVIDGRLTEGDRLMLTPRTGRLDRWWSGTVYMWDLTASSTTQPTK